MFVRQSFLSNMPENSAILLRSSTVVYLLYTNISWACKSLNDIASFLFGRCEVWLKAWPVSSWMWPTGKKLTNTSSKLPNVRDIPNRRRRTCFSSLSNNCRAGETMSSAEFFYVNDTSGFGVKIRRYGLRLSGTRQSLCTDVEYSFAGVAVRKPV